ncbi:MAG: hypothetical protein J3Q66DRAFT_112215 [Benniella sp.]|nr:MAG: hypothetical protein J3Q66DRAFT_112215 [Benniella sp.]
MPRGLLIGLLIGLPIYRRGIVRFPLLCQQSRVNPLFLSISLPLQTVLGSVPFLQTTTVLSMEWSDRSMPLQLEKGQAARGERCLCFFFFFMRPFLVSMLSSPLLARRGAFLSIRDLLLLPLPLLHSMGISSGAFTVPRSSPAHIRALDSPIQCVRGQVA